MLDIFDNSIHPGNHDCCVGLESTICQKKIITHISDHKGLKSYIFVLWRFIVYIRRRTRKFQHAKGHHFKAITVC